MTQLLKGKVSLITGASRGIGRAIAQGFSEAGSDLALTYLHSREKAEALASELEKKSTRVKIYQSDASDFKQTEELIANVTKDFNQIDVLVNNAGITKDALILRMSEEAWNDVQAANLKSCFNTTKHISRQLLRQRSGCIINITSIVGIKGNPGQANYAASKAGIIGFTKSVAQELGTIGVRCNAIAPGFIQTEMTDQLKEKDSIDWKKLIPLQRFGHAEEVASACVFLASDLASYITGQVLQVDGGMG